MKKYLWIAALFAALALIFSGCPTEDNGGTSAEKVTVTFNLNGGGNATTVQVNKGQAVSRPAQNPTHSSVGFDFVDWFESATADVDNDDPFDFSTILNADKTLYAGWRIDTDFYWVVTFHDADGGVFHTLTVAKSAADQSFEEPWPGPEKDGWDLIGWWEDPEDLISDRFDFLAEDFELDGDLDLYPVFAQASEVILMGAGEFLDTWNLGYTNWDASPLVKRNGETAIQINPNPNSGNEYRMQFNFDPSFDIRNFATIEIDYELTSAGDLSGVISLFTDDDDASDNWTKTMFDSWTGSGGHVSITIGKALWYKSRELRGIEIYRSGLTGNPVLYITRMEFTGVPDPGDIEPEGGDEVTATNIFMVIDNGSSAVNSNPPTSPAVQSTFVPVKTNPPAAPTQPIFVYVYFDPLGSDFTAIKVDFDWFGGGNFNIRGAYDAANTRRNSTSNYLGWKGWDNIPSFTFAVDSEFPASLDRQTMKCIVFEIGPEEGGGDAENILTLTGVTFIVNEAPPPDGLEPIYLFNGGTALLNGATFVGGAEPTIATIENNTIIVNTPTEFRFGLNIDPPIDLTGYVKLFIDMEIDGTATGMSGNIMFSGGADTNWSLNITAPFEYAITGKPNLTYFQLWSNAVSNVNKVTIKSISFEPAGSTGE